MLHKILNTQFTLPKRSILISMLVILVCLLAACASPADDSLLQEAPPRRGGTDVAGEVIKMTVDVLGVDFDSVSDSSSFKDDLGATDEQMSELASKFEAAFSVELSDVEISGLTTVKSAVDLIKSKQ